MADTIVMLLLLIGLSVADWGQTLDIADRGAEMGIVETNPILGEDPSRADDNTFFIRRSPEYQKLKVAF